MAKQIRNITGAYDTCSKCSDNNMLTLGLMNSHQMSVINNLIKKHFLMVRRDIHSNTLKKNLKKDYIFIKSLTGKSGVVSLCDSTHKILREKCKSDKKASKICENERIIEMAASIIRDEIRLSVHNLSEYPTFENSSLVIPESFKLFLYKSLDPKCKNSAVPVVNRRCTEIAHSVISTCRPRSFISPLLLAIYQYIYITSMLPVRW